MSDAGERFDTFTTTAEERWLAGSGPRPASPQERLPERAGLMIPHAGAGAWWVEDLRTVRLWVDEAGALQLRDNRTGLRQVAAPGQVHGCWWVQGPALDAIGLPSDRSGLPPAKAGQPVAEAGWLVLLGVAGPVLALRMRDWTSPRLQPDEPDAMRATGAEGVARALGADLEAVADPTEARQRLGMIDPAVLFTLDQPSARRYAATVLGTLLALLVAYPLLLIVLPPVVATGIAVAGLLAMPAYDLVPLAGRYRRTARLPAETTHWWPAQPARPGAGIGSVDGVAGPELVLADGYGWEGRFPGPALGGAASLVVARTETGSVQGLLLYDRDQRLLELLDARDWVGPAAAVESLSAAAADLGLVISTTTMPRLPTLAGRRLSRSAGHNDVYTGLGAMICAGGMSVAFGCIALVEFLIGEGVSLFVTGAVLLALRVALRFRRVV